MTLAVVQKRRVRFVLRLGVPRVSGVMGMYRVVSRINCRVEPGKEGAEPLVDVAERFDSNSRNHSAWKEATIEQRKRRFQFSVSMYVLTMRNLRQHSRVLPRNVSCEISLSLRLLEEFFCLSFTRFWGFLGERGLVDPVSSDSSQR
ncbi:hypothetical protein PsorP6_008866 [Peronosclerospora sorghi]|uniref:Uncharacterized protein n=1 Tax=Peronosclerospora sorghi TaxID=230839 RepID=A0ACC0VZG0_9STRA|nr:hypothetical protein PsorP6_008866 [Peronosclerospora sorghi]